MLLRNLSELLTFLIVGAGERRLRLVSPRDKRPILCVTRVCAASSIVTHVESVEGMNAIFPNYPFSTFTS